mgnify:CR=1 FL=1
MTLVVGKALEEFIKHIQTNIQVYILVGVFILCIVLPIIIFNGKAFLENNKLYTQDDYNADRCEGSPSIYINRILIILAIIYILMKTILKDFFETLETTFPFLTHLKNAEDSIFNATQREAAGVSPTSSGGSSSSIRSRISSGMGKGHTKMVKILMSILICSIPIICIVIASISISESTPNTSLNIINVLGLIFTLIITNKVFNHMYYIIICILLLIPLLLFLSACDDSSNKTANILTIIYYVVLMITLGLDTFTATKKILNDLKLLKSENIFEKIFHGGKNLKRKNR